jgi:hypothetical protein
MPDGKNKPCEETAANSDLKPTNISANFSADCWGFGEATISETTAIPSSVCPVDETLP